MADRLQRVRQVTTREGDTVRTVKEVDDPALESAQRQNLAERVVWFIAGVLLVILGFRFVLALLGANPNNAFADFVYTVSYPFVKPFFSLFNYDLQNGISRFELYTLVAMAVYALIAYGVARLLTINRS